jgi:hypothetical protein
MTDIYGSADERERRLAPHAVWFRVSVLESIRCGSVRSGRDDPGP